ncbi:hypothetical protein PVAR5_1093 [Paecilomyces variotii No. 5]|uniref:Uncharacterized protein n=1 Tax=Byssochlamys spectabilis (strain No. 5 / NBRC 109023) TaxID=1356009 RepID=V5FS50_BYSSN|nr:hypothetical protein PVAR5_1093 [Paecilomyces variotii No. 5]
MKHESTPPPLRSDNLGVQAWKTTVVVVTDRDGTVDSRVEEGIEAGELDESFTGVEEGGAQDAVSTGWSSRQITANGSVSDLSKSWRKEERRREKEAEMEERERKVRREFLSPGGCRGEKEKRSRESRREVEVPGPSVGAFAARARFTAVRTVPSRFVSSQASAAWLALVSIRPGRERDWLQPESRRLGGAFSAGNTGAVVRMSVRYNWTQETGPRRPTISWLDRACVHTAYLSSSTLRAGIPASGSVKLRPDPA